MILWTTLYGRMGHTSSITLIQWNELGDFVSLWISFMLCFCGFSCLLSYIMSLLPVKVVASTFRMYLLCCCSYLILTPSGYIDRKIAGICSEKGHLACNIQVAVLKSKTGLLSYRSLHEYSSTQSSRSNHELSVLYLIFYVSTRSSYRRKRSYIDKGWCEDVLVLRKTCSPILEAIRRLLLRILFMQEFSSFILVQFYIPPQACGS